MHPILIIVFAPLVAALIAGLGNRFIGNVAAKSVTTGALLLSAGLSWPIFLGYLGGTETAEVVQVLKWVESGTLSFDWALRVDTLTAIMLVVINSVSALVHLYSWGYMEEDPDQPRFFAYLSLFTFAMLMLVTADNLVQMFFGWEGVGVASYLLIGFYYKKPSANAAAIKAFVVNRVGDFGFVLGIGLLFAYAGTMQVQDATTGEDRAADADWHRHLSRAMEAGRLAGRGIGAAGLRLADLPEPATPWEVILRRLVTRASMDCQSRQLDAGGVGRGIHDTRRGRQGVQFGQGLRIPAAVGLGRAAALTHLDLQRQRLGDLLADREDRIERGHRLLKDHRDLVAAHLAHLLGIERQKLAPLQLDAAFDAAGDLRQKPHDRKRGHAFARP